MAYSVPYILLFTWLLFLYYLDHEIKSSSNYNKFQIIAICSYLIFYGLRGYIYTDVFGYSDIFTNINSNHSFTFNDGIEPGWILINLIFHQLSDNYIFFQFFMTLIDVIGISLILKREIGEKWLLAFAFTIPFFDGIQINNMRNIKAIILLFYAIQYLRAQKPKKFLLCAILASTFHISAIFVIPIFILAKRNIPKSMLALFILSIILYFVGISRFIDNLLRFADFFGGRISVKAYVMLDQFMIDRGFSFGFIYRCIIGIVLLLNYRNLYKRNPIISNLAIFYIIIANAFNSSIILRDRASGWFVIALICILPMIFEILKQKKMLALFWIFNLACCYGMIYSQHFSKISQYENVIFGISSKNDRLNILINEI
jgi:hypothetical protein